MQDLTHIYADMGSDPVTCLVPTSQEAGNQQHDNELARSAPGTAPAAPVRTPLPGEDVTHEPPEVDWLPHITPVVRDATGAHVTGDSNSDRPSPFTRADGSGWNSAPGDAPAGRTAARSMIRRGQWNEI